MARERGKKQTVSIVKISRGGPRVDDGAKKKRGSLAQSHVERKARLKEGRGNEEGRSFDKKAENKQCEEKKKSSIRNLDAGDRRCHDSDHSRGK